MKVITFSSLKGGTGKTSVALQVAGKLALKNKVLMIDLDSQKNTSLVLASEDHTDTIHDLLNDKINISDAIHNSVFKNVDFIQGSLKMSDITIDTLTFKRKLESIYNEYDYVIFDTPPVINSAVRSAYAVSDIVISPIQYELFNISNVDTLITKIQDVNKHTKIVLVPNMVNTRSKLYKTVGDFLEDSITQYDNVIIGTELPASIEMANLLIDNKLLINTMKVNKLKSALNKLVTLIKKEIG